MKRVEIPTHWRRHAVVISDVREPEKWFAEEELAETAAFRLEKRRREWMLSRIAAKHLAMKLGVCGDDPTQCRAIDRRIDSHYVSFSHSHGYAAAAIGEAPVGIDVETVREIKPAAAHLFLTSDEGNAAAACALPNALLHFWCAKEAAWKRLGGAVLTLSRVPLTLVTVSERGLVFEGGVETDAPGDVVVGLAL